MDQALWPTECSDEIPGLDAADAVAAPDESIVQLVLPADPVHRAGQ